MVDQAATKEETSNEAHGESSNEKEVAQGNKAFKKVSINNNTDIKKYRGISELLKIRIHYC